MYSSGYTHISNIDFSPTVITTMQQLTSHQPLMSWHTMDITNMSFTSHSFHVAIDKGIRVLLYRYYGCIVM